MSAQVIEAVTSAPGTQSAGFLNDVVGLLWPNINVAASKMIKDIVEPMFVTLLPGPLSSLRFSKLDLGSVPMKLTNVDVHKTEGQGINIDMDVDWDGECDIELQGKMIPKMGVEHVKLKGRLSILLCPLTNVLPLIGATQIAFVNPPTLSLDFTDAANLADCGLIGGTIRQVILDIIASMAVLPNRYLLKLDAANDYLKTYQHHVGVLRLTVGKTTGIGVLKKGGVKGFLNKIVKDIPDCYCNVNVGAEKVWRTSTKANDYNPAWDETKDFLVMDQEQCVVVDINDDDMVGDDDIGMGITTIRQIIFAGGTQELGLVRKGQPLEATLAVHAKFFDFVPDLASFAAAENQGAGQICGLVTVLVASVLDIKGERDQLAPSVRVNWGANEFRTVTKTYSPGVDIFNPAFDTPFRMPITADLLKQPANFKLTLMNKTDDAGSVEVPFADVAGAPGMQLEKEFDVGSGVLVRASIQVRGTKVAQ